MKRTPTLVALTLLVLLACAPGALALEPPQAGELDRYRADGTLAAREAFAARLGNQDLAPGLAARLRAKTLLERVGAGGPALLPPSGWRGMPTKGNVKILTLLIDFSDYPALNSAASIQSKLFGSGIAGDYPYESLTNYYKRSSYDQLTIGGNVLGWYRAGSRAAVPQTTAGRQALIKQALQSYDVAGHDFSQYDNDGDGVIDYLVVVWTGPHNGWANFWWGYQTTYSDATFLLDGKKLSTYSWQWEYQYTGSPPSPAPYDQIVVIHETGHALGLPDYYDYDDTVGPKGGAGGLDMMDANWGDHNAFSKWILDWITPQVITGAPQSVTLTPSGTTNQALVVMPGASSSNPFSEYFMVQNRQRVGNDSNCVNMAYQNMPGDGLVIWHLDARLKSTVYGDDYLYDNSYTAHKLLRLMEADGLEHVETTSGTTTSPYGWAGAGDYYKNGTVFNNASVPNSKKYDGTATTVLAAAIGAPGLSMTFLAGVGSADTTPPNTTIDSGPSGTVTDSIATFTFSSTEIGSTFACRIDSGSWTACSSPKTVSGLTNGSHTFEVRAIDAAGNTDASPASRTWTVADSTPPETTIDTGPAGTVGSSSATFTFSASEAGSTFQCRLDAGSWGACTSPKTYSGLTLGSHTFDVKATDPNGNTDATPASRTWTVVLPPPNDNFADAQLLSGASFTRSGDSSANATKEAGEPNHANYAGGRSVWYRWTPADSGQVVLDTFTSNFDTLLAVYTGSAVNALTLVAANDQYGGNQSQVTFTATAGTTYRIAVDGYLAASGTVVLHLLQDTPPETTIDSGPSGIVTSSSATFTFSANEAGSTFQCRLDSGSWGACTSPKTYSGLAVGSHTFEVKATDTTGNTDPTPASRTWTVVTPPPNDNFASAQLLSGTNAFRVGDTSVGAGKEAGEPNHAGNAGGRSVWYRWTPSGSGLVVIDTFSSSFNTLLAVYTGSAVNALTPVASNDQYGGDQSQVSFVATAGTTYRIAVDGYGAASGSVTLHLYVPPETTIDSGPSGAVNSSSAVFTFSANDAGSTFAGRLDGGVWEDCTSVRTDLATGGAPAAVAVADFNGDGRPDLVTANFGTNTVSVLLGSRNGGVGAKTDFVTGMNPQSVAVGDFNADGAIDLATANYAANTVSVLLGDGSGDFAARTDFVTGPYPVSVAVGDFNADGAPDLVTADYASSTVSVLLGDGGGFFGYKTDFFAGPYPWSVAVADFNADGKADVVTANGSGTVSVLLGDGNGALAAQTAYPIGSASFSVAVGDVNADGKSDVLATNYNANTVSVLLGNGSGGFGAKTDFATGGSPDWVTAGDFNADGKPDLVTANYSASTASVLLGNGSGGFGAKTDFATDNGPYSVAVGDFNADGKQDLATANFNAGTVSLLLGDGGGGVLVAARYTGLAEGPHTFEVRATDPDGNTDPTPVTRTWTVDTVAPSTTNNADGLPHRSFTLVFASSDDRSGVAATEYRIDGGTWRSGTSVTLRRVIRHKRGGYGRGWHLVEYRSTDNAGNRETIQGCAVRIG